MIANRVGIVPAAGRGTRLSPLPFSKELFPLGYQRIGADGKAQWRPKVVSQYMIEQMAAAGAERIFIILGSGKEAIMEYYGNGERFGVHLSYLFQEELSGIPYALDLARPWMRNDLVLFGMPDTIIEPSNVFKGLIQAHTATNSDVSVGVFRTDTPHKFGMVEIDEADRIVDNVDKPLSTDLEYMWGVACWSPSFVELVHDFLRREGSVTREVVLSELFQLAHDSGLDVRAVRFDDGEYLDIGTVKELNRAIERYSVIPDYELIP